MIRVFLLFALLLLAAPAYAQDENTGLPPSAAPTKHIQVNSLPVVDATPKFDAGLATNAYLARVSGAARARSDAYFEGGYGLMVVDLIWGLAVAAALLWSGFSARLRDWEAGWTENIFARDAIYAGAYVAIVTAAELPLALYEGFFREHDYGLSTQSFPAWAGDAATAFALSLAATVILAPLLYAAIRRAGRSWWLWGAGLVIAFQIVTAVIYPVFIAPLFNHYAPLPEGALKTQILSLARANDIPADNVWLVDASRQSNRISANVSGFLGTTRISLTDNLIKQGTPDEVLAVVGHEMGHYVMGHVLRETLLLGLVIIAAFAFVNWAFGWALTQWGAAWRVQGLQDIAGLPLLMALISIFFFAATPVTNSISRNAEHQADIFGLDAVRKPDAFATAMLKLATYRKLEPGALEEILFYDHPSGRTRIMDAMVWKKEHIRDADVRDTVSPNTQ